MKTWMKIASVALLAFVTNVSIAQSTKENLKDSTPEERAKVLTEIMDEDLQLDEDQKESVYNVNFSIAEEVETLKSSSGSKRDKFSKLKEIDSKRDGKMKSVLNSDQYQTYLEHKKDYRKEAKERMG